MNPSLFFDFLLSNEKAILNTFKVFLSDSKIPLSDDFQKSSLHQKIDLGPPGQEYFLALLDKEYGNKISRSAKKWAIKPLWLCCFSGALAP